MGEHTNIAWSNATWNPVTGCSKVSDGCSFCYAETLSLRMGWSDKPWAAAYAAENVKLHPDRLDAPLKWKTPRMIFVNSMSDLFHEQVPNEYVNRIFGVMMRCPQHTFQVLTKRPERMRGFVEWWRARPHGDPFVPWHIWLGTSVENQREADNRIPYLLATPAAVRFLSCEPLLGPVDLETPMPGTPSHGGVLPPWYTQSGLHWVIAGGESGSHLGKPEHADRWMKPEWARSIRDQCVRSGIPFFMKQHSALRPGQKPWIEEADGTRTEWHQFPERTVA